PILDVTSARLGVNVSEREVSELPVNGRQLSQLMLQPPGAQNTGTGTCHDVRFSGRANEQNVIKYDVAEGSAIVDASQGNGTGKNFVESVPSAVAWARAVPAVANLRSGFLAPGAVILAGTSTNADFDIAQLQQSQVVTENSFSGRFDVKMNSNWSAYVRVFHD